MNDIYEQWVAELDGKSSYMVFEQALPELDTGLTVELWAKNTVARGPNDQEVWFTMEAKGQRRVDVLHGWGSKLYWDAPFIDHKDHNYDRIDRAIDNGAHHGVWTHWAFVRDTTKGTSAIVRNGSVWHQGEGLHRTFVDVIDKLQVGCGENLDNYWAAQLTELRVWDHARTTAEIDAAKNTRLHGDEDGLAAYWPLCEGRGDVLFTGLKQPPLQGTGHNLGWQIAALPLAPADPALTRSGSLHYWQTWRRHQQASAPPLRRGRLR